MNFEEFLDRRLHHIESTTETILAAFLPLLRQVIALHQAGGVAPLEGILRLEMTEGRLSFPEGDRLPHRLSADELRRVESADSSALQVVGVTHREVDADPAAQAKVRRGDVAPRGEPLVRPVYLPGYVAWEHELQHQDPLTDTFSLGMILATLALRLNFNDPNDLSEFVTHRRNLFELREDLHPVLAQVILRMTELDRRRRPRDLRAILAMLENPGEQTLDLEVDLVRVPGFDSPDRRTRTQAILARLRDRLFDFSRRNNLLAFRPTLQSVNLTVGSIPLRIDPATLRDDRILVWNERLQRQFVEGKPIPLGRHCDFNEAVYLPPQFDGMIAAARRDNQEFGFAQLRLVACFLSWANLKRRPVERYLSPLVLLPVELVRHKGVRDNYSLTPLSQIAEINPVVRRVFQQQYGIPLPESVDLSTGSLDELFTYLSTRIAASEPAVILNKVDRPRIELIHERAKQRVEQYRRTARRSGRGIRSHLDFDYSYDRANYHPLGLKLFTELVRRPASHLGKVVGQPQPRPRLAFAEQETGVVEAERVVAAVQSTEESNPYLWNFDLCNLTLGNFRYRRMSLVQDYEAILQRNLASQAFEAAFSEEGAPEVDPPPVLELAERFDVVPSDPTQTAAIALAHREASYIIQGPPGTGKSQTITNLIADFVARGKRVLFVCEKRAAIDVVYARLKQAGLGPLCCLIHDSQTDKREFIEGLKETYEEFQKQVRRSRRGWGRDELTGRLQDALAPMNQFQQAMNELLGPGSLTIREFLDRRLSLERFLNGCPPAATVEFQTLPAYVEWWEARRSIDRLRPLLEQLTPTGVFAEHPLRRIAPRLVECERPNPEALEAADQATELLAKLRNSLERSGIEPACRATLEKIGTLLEYLRLAAPLAAEGNLSLANPGDRRSKTFARACRELEQLRQALDRARQQTVGWREKFSPADARAALEQARSWQRNPFAWLFPGWWRLRSELARRYDASLHAVRPTWPQILAPLVDEYSAAEACDAFRGKIGDEFAGGGSPEDLKSAAIRLRESLPRFPEWLGPLHDRLQKESRGAVVFEHFPAIAEFTSRLQEQLGRVLVDVQNVPLETLPAELAGVRTAIRQLPLGLGVLAVLRELPESIGTAIRRLPYTLVQIEALAARATWEDLRQSRPVIERFGGQVRDLAVGRLSRGYGPWLAANSAEIRLRTRKRFREKFDLIGAPSGSLSAAAKELRQSYTKGQRGLKHEFGKTMRFKAIRELVEGETGPMIRDLKPVWLMSPLSVSDTLPLDPEFVDVVIFDEASQIPLEEAIPTLFRGRQVIVVGDEKQLPPTNFFSTRSAEEQAEGEVASGSPPSGSTATGSTATGSPEADSMVEPMEADGESTDDSFLRFAARNLPATMLQWHYRSRSESLIAFSNQSFYQGRLLTVPDSGELQATDEPRAETLPSGGIELLLERPLSFHFVENGVYERRRNRLEAETIARLVAGVLETRPELTVGVIAFSEAQQSEIEGALTRLAEQDPEFRGRLEAEREREIDGQFAGLLVRNLENIQGDERDVVLVSICYGPNPQGKMLMNFGPINRDGGERRLNVAFSRARRFMAIVSSIRSEAITNDYNPGPLCLKNFLAYAAATSRGDLPAAKRILNSLNRVSSVAAPAMDGPADDSLVAELSAELRTRGYLVELRVGVSRFQVDLAVRRPGDRRHRLAILVDSPEHYGATEPWEREFVRPRLLKSFGWDVTSVLARDWLEAREEVLRRIVELLQRDPSTAADVPPADAVGEGAGVESTDGDQAAENVVDDPETEVDATPVEPGET